MYSPAKTRLFLLQISRFDANAGDIIATSPGKYTFANG